MGGRDVFCPNCGEKLPEGSVIYQAKVLPGEYTLSLSADGYEGRTETVKVEEITLLEYTLEDAVNWVNAYLKLLDKIKAVTYGTGEIEYLYDDDASLFDGKKFTGFSLIYIDDNEIPELIMHGKYETTGNLIYTIGWLGMATGFETGGLWFGYVEKGGILVESFESHTYSDPVHTGVYIDYVVTLENGKFDTIEKGRRDTSQDEKVYTWNNNTVTEAEYYELLGQYTSGVTLIENDYEPDYTLDELTAYLAAQ